MDSHFSLQYLHAHKTSRRTSVRMSDGHQKLLLPPHTHVSYTQTHTHKLTLFTQQEGTHFYCNVNVVSVQPSLTHSSSFSNKHTNTLSQSSSKQSTPTPPFPRERERERLTILEANVFPHALDRAVSVPWLSFWVCVCESTPLTVAYISGTDIDQQFPELTNTVSSK